MKIIRLPSVRYEVQTWTLCDGWVNTWTVLDERGSEPETISTRKEAQAALDEFLLDIQSEIDAGQRDPEHGYDASEFRIVPVGGVDV